MPVNTDFEGQSLACNDSGGVQIPIMGWREGEIFQVLNNTTAAFSSLIPSAVYELVVAASATAGVVTVKIPSGATNFRQFRLNTNAMLTLQFKLLSGQDSINITGPAATDFTLVRLR